MEDLDGKFRGNSLQIGALNVLASVKTFADQLWVQHKIGIITECPLLRASRFWMIRLNFLVPPSTGRGIRWATSKR